MRSVRVCLLLIIPCLSIGAETGYHWPKYASAVMYKIPRSGVYVPPTTTLISTTATTEGSTLTTAVATSVTASTTVATTTTIAVTTTATSNCAPPSNYEAKGDHFYYLNTDTLTHQDAKSACEDQNAHLAHFKTKEEYDTMLDYINGTGYTRMYIGLEKPIGTIIECDGDCLGFGLKWTDDTDFEGGDFITRGIKLDNLEDVGNCLVVNEPGATALDGKVVDPNGIGCQRTMRSLCQFSC